MERTPRQDLNGTWVLTTTDGADGFLSDMGMGEQAHRTASGSIMASCAARGLAEPIPEIPCPLPPGWMKRKAAAAALAGSASTHIYEQDGDVFVTKVQRRGACRASC